MTGARLLSRQQERMVSFAIEEARAAVRRRERAERFMGLGRGRWVGKKKAPPWEAGPSGGMGITCLPKSFS
jgi:hypothetical protein